MINWAPTLAQAGSTNVITTVVTDYNPWAVNAQHLSASNSFTVIVSGTVPGSLPFMITSMNVSNRVAWVTWNSVVGQTYRLQYRDTLRTTNWQDVLPDVVATGTTTTTTNNLGNATQRFYRITLVQTAPAPVIKSVTVAGNLATITWTSTANRVYRLQYLSSLGGTNWQEVPSDVTATGSTATTTNDVSGTARRFYRIRLVQ